MNPFLDLYDRPEMVARYLDNYLEKPEILLLHEVTRRTAACEMLDLGVGAGRTTFFFAPFTKRYVGVDLAPRMITACRERFPGQPGRLTPAFITSDAVTLNEIGDASFDIVLFSLNGIDCIAPRKRDDCLRTIQRVLRPGGTLLFSSHNVQMIDFYFEDGATSPTDSAYPVLDKERRRQIKIHNNPLAACHAQDQVLFWDGVYDDDGSCKHVFIRPRFQIRELERLGFEDVRALSSLTGEALTEDNIDELRDPSAHYWCHKAG